MCGSVLQRGHSGDGSLSSLILFTYERSRGHLFVPGCSWECCFREMYCEWYGVCDSVVLSVVEVCANYGGVNVFMFVLILAASMVLGSVSMFVV